MKIDRALNLVVPVDTDEGTIYVHSTPISMDVFERYWLPISKAHAAIYKEELALVSGPKVAARMLKRVSLVTRGDDGAENMWGGTDGVENGLMAEIRRLTNLVVPTQNGWTTLPFQSAEAKKRLSERDVSEVENLVCFFTLGSAMHDQKRLPEFLDALASLWNSQIVSSNSTAFASSLRTSNGIDASGETGPTSSATPSPGSSTSDSVTFSHGTA